MNLSKPIEPFIGQFVVSLRNQFSYRTDMMLSLLLRIFYPVITIVVWSAIFFASKASTIGGYTLPELMVYFLIMSTTNIIVWYGDAFWTMQEDVSSGYVAAKLVRPVSYPLSVLAEGFAQTLFYYAIIGIPMTVVVTLTFNLQVSASTVALFGASLAISFLISFLAEFLLGCLTFYFIDVTGLGVSYFWVAFLLAGGLIPLSVFPGTLGTVLTSSPFAYQVYIPISIYTGTFTYQAAVNALLLGLLWVAAFAAIGFSMWKLSRRHIDAVGV